MHTYKRLQHVSIYLIQTKQSCEKLSSHNNFKAEVIAFWMTSSVVHVVVIWGISSYISSLRSAWVHLCTALLRSCLSTAMQLRSGLEWALFCRFFSLLVAEVLLCLRSPSYSMTQYHPSLSCQTDSRTFYSRILQYMSLWLIQWLQGARVMWSYLSNCHFVCLDLTLLT